MLVLLDECHMQQRSQYGRGSRRKPKGGRERARQRERETAFNCKDMSPPGSKDISLVLGPIVHTLMMFSCSLNDTLLSETH